MTLSKPLSQDDESGFVFAQEMLQGDPTYAINFDRIQHHPEKGYIIFEYLRCHENQPHVTPHTSHPNKYFFKNKHKFLSLYQIAKDLNATLYLVNYAKMGTPHADLIRIMKVLSIDETDTHNPVRTENFETTRSVFSERFRKLNKECAYRSSAS